MLVRLLEAAHGTMPASLIPPGSRSRNGSATRFAARSTLTATAENCGDRKGPTRRCTVGPQLVRSSTRHRRRAAPKGRLARDPRGPRR